MATNGDKIENQRDEELGHAPTHATYFEKDAAEALTPEHRQYLLDRHGTLDLDPLPTLGDADPYNWPSWKVHRPFIY